jgi:hypothetical protein
VEKMSRQQVWFNRVHCSVQHYVKSTRNKIEIGSGVILIIFKLFFQKVTEKRFTIILERWGGIVGKEGRR